VIRGGSIRVCCTDGADTVALMTDQGASIDGGTDTIVFVAHGSRAEAANSAHEAVARQLGDRLGAPVVAAFLELAEPSIAAGIEQAVATGASRVLVLPYFLYPGRHLTRDIPELVAAAAASHPSVAIEVLDAFGADPDVVGLLATQAERALHP